jgi:hypothetical protein
MEKTIWGIVKDLQTETAMLTKNLVLDAFDKDQCKWIDANYATDNYIKSKRNQCINHLRKCTIDISDHHTNAFNTYNEIVVYRNLKKRCKVVGEIECDKSKPDFIFTTTEGSNVNIDLKTLSFADGKSNLREVQFQFLHSNVEMESGGSSKSTPSVKIGTPIVYSPFRRIHKNEQITRKSIIELFITKIAALYDDVQLSYQGNPGILLVDTVILDFPNYVHEILPYYLYPGTDFLLSGCLWQSCFGKEGIRTLEYVEFEGSENIGESLSRNGLLTGDTSLKAIIYIINSGNKKTFLGLFRADIVEKSIFEFLNKISDYMNDDMNSDYSNISQDAATFLTLNIQ